MPDPNILWWIAVPIVDATGSPNGIKTLLANGLRTFPIKGNAVFNNDSKGLPKNLLDCPIADATGSPYGIKTLLANGLRTFPIKGNAVFSNGSKCLPKNLLDCPIWCNWVFDNFILAEELLVKALRGFETFNVY